MRALVLGLLLIGSPAAAETLRDAASGIAITAPEGYVATPSPPSGEGPGRAVFDVRRPGETDTGCRIAVNPAPSNAFVSQEQLNLRVNNPQYQQAVIRQLSTVYELLSVSPVLQRDVIGLAAIGDLRPRPGQPARAAEIRFLVVFLDTPIQNVSLTCIGERADFQDRIVEFEAIARGLELQ